MSDGAPDAAFLNGQATRDAWLVDRGLHFGDGVFETISCRAGRPRFLKLHLERLMHGCRRLSLGAIDESGLRACIMQLAAEAGTCIVKVIVTRGHAVARGYAFTGDERPTQIVLRYPTSEAPAQNPLCVGISSMRLGENPLLAGLKHLNRLEQVLAQKQRQEQQLDELLMLSSSGKLVSGTMSNVFLVKDGRVLTPSLDMCGVAGIMRRVVLREAARAGMPCEERVLDHEDLQSATELFLSSSRLGVVSVADLEGHALRATDITRKIQQLIAPLLAGAVDE
jgi:4-amino-4-deoxychorismate lyase